MYDTNLCLSDPRIRQTRIHFQSPLELRQCWQALLVFSVQYTQQNEGLLRASKGQKKNNKARRDILVGHDDKEREKKQSKESCLQTATAGPLGASRAALKKWVYSFIEPVHLIIWNFCQDRMQCLYRRLDVSLVHQHLSHPILRKRKLRPQMARFTVQQFCLAKVARRVVHPRLEITALSLDFRGSCVLVCRTGQFDDLQTAPMRKSSYPCKYWAALFLNTEGQDGVLS